LAEVYGILSKFMNRLKGYCMHLRVLLW